MILLTVLFKARGREIAKPIEFVSEFIPRIGETLELDKEMMPYDTAVHPTNPNVFKIKKVTYKLNTAAGYGRAIRRVELEVERSE